MAIKFSRIKALLIIFIFSIGALQTIPFTKAEQASNNANNNNSPITASVGMANPAAIYCRDSGYIYKNAEELCVFPNNTKCDAWDFLKGKCGKKYSYCNKMGFDVETLNDGKNAFSSEYAVCVDQTFDLRSFNLFNKKKTPVTDLFQLNKKIRSKCLNAPKLSQNNLSIKGAEQKGAGSPFEGPLLGTFDWRNLNGKNWLTPVKNQGSCGSCWAFSAVGVVESLYKINGSFADLDLSEENLVSDCFGGGSCCGGWHNEALDFIKNAGITNEEYFPYVDNTCECKNSSCSAELVLRQYNKSDSDTVLGSLRSFRDRKIKTEYTNAYYEYSPYIEKVLIRDPLLAKDAAELIIKYMPAIKYITGDDNGKDLKINKADIKQIISFSERLKIGINKNKEKIEFEKIAKLLELIESFEAAFKLSDGKSFSQFLQSSDYFENNPKKLVATNEDEKTGCQCKYNNINSGSNVCSNATCSDRISGFELWKIADWHSVDNSQDSIKRYLISKGPLSVAMGMGDDYGGSFNKGIYQCSDDSGVNHAVVIAGYNDEGEYWIVRNSWGKNWEGSDDGYFKVGYNECSIENHVYYADYADLAPYHLPNQPDENDLGQLRSDGATAIEIGSAIDGNSIIIKSRISHPDNLQVKLQVELRNLNEYGGKFDETKGGLKESELIASGEESSINIYRLTNESYHWRARVIDENDHKSEWVEFGNNDISEADFVVESDGTTPKAPFYVEVQNEGGVAILADIIRDTTSYDDIDDVLINNELLDIAVKANAGETASIKEFQSTYLCKHWNNYSENEEEKKEVCDNHNAEKGWGALGNKTTAALKDFFKSIQLIDFYANNAVLRVIESSEKRWEQSDSRGNIWWYIEDAMAKNTKGWIRKDYLLFDINKQDEWKKRSIKFISPVDTTTYDTVKVSSVFDHSSDKFNCFHSTECLFKNISDKTEIEKIMNNTIVINKNANPEIYTCLEGTEENINCNVNTVNSEILFNCPVDGKREITCNNKTKVNIICNDLDKKITCDKKVEAFNGEIGDIKNGASVYPFGYYKDKKQEESFFKSSNLINYERKYLDYDGHTGYDFAESGKIVAAADGVLCLATIETAKINNIEWREPTKCQYSSDPVNSKSAPDSWKSNHTFYIVHEDTGYTTWYLHADDIEGDSDDIETIKGKIKEDGYSDVKSGDIIGKIGGYGNGDPNQYHKHLHFEVRLNGIDYKNLVDPYQDGMWKESQYGSHTLISIGSPGELRVYDNMGNVTGLVDNKVFVEIPFSKYVDEKILLYNTNIDKIEINGTENDVYQLKVVEIGNNKRINFDASNIMTSPGAIHQYAIDWDALFQGEQGTTLTIDLNGDGNPEETIKAGNTLDMGTNLESQISLTQMLYGGEDILNAVAQNIGDNLAPLLLSELKESQVDLEDYSSDGKLESGQKKKLKLKFKFLETAGNEYQGKSINVNFKFLGTQEER